MHHGGLRAHMLRIHSFRSGMHTTQRTSLTLPWPKPHSGHDESYPAPAHLRAASRPAGPGEPLDKPGSAPLLPRVR